MGSLNQQPLNIQDLKVTLLSCSNVQPSEPTERRSMFLSNIDQVLNFNMEAVTFFSANPRYPLDTVVERGRSAFGRLLVTYDFLAGRLQLNEAGKLEIDCNGAGVGLVMASSALRLEELGDLSPNLAFRKLTPVGLEDQPLLAFQVTSFKCGGYACGMSINHIAMDAFSSHIFFVNLAALISNKPLVIEPYTNRQILAARSPPRVTFSHPELVKLEDLEEFSSPSTMFDDTSCGLEFKIFSLNPNQIALLKEEAKTKRDGSSPKIASSFNVVIAHLWRCRVLASNARSEKKTSTIIYPVDIRKRLRPPLPPSYTGNAILAAYASATCQELEAGPFSRTVELVRQGAERMTDEYIRSAIDWGEFYKGFPKADVMFTTWWKFGFDDLEFEWGKPKCFCPLPNPGRELIMMFPGADKGVNATVGLPSDILEKFRHLFYSDLVPLCPRL